MFSGGLGSKRRVRKLSEEKERTSSVLPTMSPSRAYKSPRGTTKTRHHHDVNPCNAFLMGGTNYYPGKDKHRIHRGRAHWSRRCGCSRPVQLAIASVVIAYLCLWWLLVPLVSYTLSVGAAFSGDTRGTTLNANGPMYLSTPDGLDRILLEPISSLRNRVVVSTRPSSASNHHMLAAASNDRAHRNVIKSIERIIPDFFHRNDHNTQQEEQQQQSFASKSHNSQAELLSNPHQQQQNRRTSGLDVDSSATTTESSPNVTTYFTGEPRVQRTLLNMDQQLQQPTSTCPSALPREPSVTLVIQCSLDRLWILNSTCARWDRPVVVALAIFPDDETVDQQLLSLRCPQARIIKYSVDQVEDYPVNTLRNIALDAVQTSHLLMVDVDFVPSADLATTIIETLTERQQQRHLLPDMVSDERDAIVVPAFERLQDCSSQQECASFLKNDPSFLPANLDKLQQCLVDHDCDIFQRKDNWEGHHSTNTPAWLKREWFQERTSPDGKQTISTLKQIDCFDSLRYEPYVVLRWCPSSSESTSTPPVAPYYDERFFGYGKNKISTLTHLRMMGYRFAILPQAFIIHNPHVESSVKAIWNDRKHHALHKDMDALYGQFLRELYEKYANQTSLIIKQC